MSASMFVDCATSLCSHSLFISRERDLMCHTALNERYHISGVDEESMNVAKAFSIGLAAVLSLTQDQLHKTAFSPYGFRQII